MIKIIILSFFLSSYSAERKIDVLYLEGDSCQMCITTGNIEVCTVFKKCPVQKKAQ